MWWNDHSRSDMTYMRTYIKDMRTTYDHSKSDQIKYINTIFCNNKYFHGHINIIWIYLFLFNRPKLQYIFCVKYVIYSMESIFIQRLEYSVIYYQVPCIKKKTNLIQFFDVMFIYLAMLERVLVCSQPIVLPPSNPYIFCREMEVL